MEFSVLSSGSRANAIYLSSGGESLLVDCGLSGRELERRLRRLSLSLSGISAVLVSHEHSDHVIGIPQLMKKHPMPVFATEGSWAAAHELGAVPEEHRRRYRSGEQVQIGKFTVEPFSVLHDAMDPVMYRISDGESVVCIITDLGQATTLVKERIRGANALIIEANHDHELLNLAPYPWSLKQRIRSRHGHLSNEEAGSVLDELRRGEWAAPRVIIAAHISEKSNTPHLARTALERGWHGEDHREICRQADYSGPKFIAASAFVETALFKLA